MLSKNPKKPKSKTVVRAIISMAVTVYSNDFFLIKSSVNSKELQRAEEGIFDGNRLVVRIPLPVSPVWSLAIMKSCYLLCVVYA